MPLSFERSCTWLWRTFVLFASFGPGSPEHFSLALPLVWCLFVPVLLLVIGRERTAAREQIASRRSLIAPRAPPLSRAIA